MIRGHLVLESDPRDTRIRKYILVQMQGLSSLLCHCVTSFGIDIDLTDVCFHEHLKVQYLYQYGIRLEVGSFSYKVRKVSLG